MVFAGHNLIAENGSILAESVPFSGQTSVAEADISFLAAERRRLTTFEGADCEGGGYEIRRGNFVGDGDLSLRKIPRTPFVPEESAELGTRAELILSLQATPWPSACGIRAPRRRSSAFPAASIPLWRFW